MIDDVNDAAWILIHTVDDIVGRPSSRDVIITPAERRRLYQHAELFASVHERNVSDDLVAELVDAARAWRATLIPKTSTASWPESHRLAVAVDALVQR